MQCACGTLILNLHIHTLFNKLHVHVITVDTTMPTSSSKTETLDPDVRENVKQELEYNLEVIRKQYASFVSCLHDSVVEMDISVESLCVYLMGLPALECDDDMEEHKLLYNIKDKLKEAGTVTKIFEVLLEDFGSFLNYDIFQSILDRYKISATDSDMLNYSEKLKAFLGKHKLSEFIKLNPRLKTISDPSKELILKFNIALPSRITKVLNLKKAIAKVLRLRTPALRLVGIDEGCVLVSFLIPPFVPDLTQEQIEEFRALSVLSIECGDHTVDLRSTPGDCS